MSTAPYLAIADAIRREIVRKKLAPHTRLPSEPDLVKLHGVARATIRRALAKLQEEGLVYSRQAVGTFVADPRVEQDLDQLLSFSEFMVYRGMTPGTRVLAAAVKRVTAADCDLVRRLGMQPGTRVVFLRRLRLGSGQPLVIASTWLPEEEARLLTVPPQSPALLIRRVGYAHGIPVEYAVDYYRGDRTQFRVRLGVLEKSVGGGPEPSAL